MRANGRDISFNGVHPTSTSRASTDLRVVAAVPFALGAKLGVTNDDSTLDPLGKPKYPLESERVFAMGTRFAQ